MKILKMAMLSIIPLLPGFSNCFGDSDDDFISIENQSDESIYIFVDDIREDSITVDEVFSHSDMHPDYHVIKEHEKRLNYWLIRDDRVYNCVIFKKSTMENHSRRELAEKNIYDKQYVLSSSELKAMNFKIIYTGK